MAQPKKPQDGPVIIKKYANRRLYNTSESSYITQEHLAQMIMDNEDFIVHDAKSGEDITRGVLVQIIFEREAKMSPDQTMLPTSFLRQLISFYGDSLQPIVPNYLQASMEVFMQNCATLNKELHGSPDQPLELIKDLTRQNMDIFGEIIKMFTHATPISKSAASITPKEESDISTTEPTQTAISTDPIGALKGQIAAIQRQVMSHAKK